MEISIGFVTLGHDEYWKQMPNVKDEVGNYSRIIKNKLISYGKIIDVGIIDNIEGARNSNQLFRKNDIDLLIIHVTTYSPSKNLIPIIREIDVPILSLHIQFLDKIPESIDSTFIIPKIIFPAMNEYSSIINRCGKTMYPVISDSVDCKEIWEDIEGWCIAVKVKKELAKTTIAQLGNYYPGMFDLCIDDVSLMNKFGISIDYIDVSSLREFYENVSDEKAGENKFSQIFEIDKRANKLYIEKCQKCIAAFENMIEEKNYNAIAMYFNGYPGTPESELQSLSIPAATYLNGQGIPVTAEGDILSALTMVILKIAGKDSLQTELNIWDSGKQELILSHSGPANFRLAEKRPYLKWLDFFHGKTGEGLSPEFSMKRGPVTISSIIYQPDNGYKLISLDADVVSDECLKTGDVNTRVQFRESIPSVIKKLTSAGAYHHLIVFPGEIDEILKKIAISLKIEYQKI